MRATAFGFVLLAMLPTRKVFGTELGLPTAGFHKGPVDVRGAVSVDSTMYSLHDANDVNATYTGSFLNVNLVGSIGILERVEFNLQSGSGGFNGYNQPPGSPDGSYRTYGGGARVTVWRSDDVPIEIGGGLQLAWWQKAGTPDVASGDRTLLVGASAHPFAGSVVYGGFLHYSIGASVPVPATVGTSDVLVAGSGYCLYGGYQLRLGLLSARIEARAEAPTFHRTGVGGSVGIEF